MSIEKEPNSNTNNEIVDNEIRNKNDKEKIDLKHFKPKILSPPDTPQISNLKKGIYK